MSTLHFMHGWIRHNALYSCYYNFLFLYKLIQSNFLFQCVCSWEDRDKMFAEVEGIIRRQINVSFHFMSKPFIF